MASLEILTAELEAHSRGGVNPNLTVGARNRSQRRSIKDPFAREAESWLARGNSLAVVLNRTRKLLYESVIFFERDITRMIYQGSPFIGEYLSAIRRLPDFLAEASMANLRLNFTTPESLASIETQNLFERSVGGITLLDIERMQLPLSSADISGINRIFYPRLIDRVIPHKLNPFKEAVDHGLIRQAAILLATQKMARLNEKVNIPSNVQSLYSRLSAYFDYYTHLMTDFSMDQVEDSNFCNILLWGRPGLPQFLGCYIPGRLGITPASAIKLFYERAQNSYLPFLYWGSDRALRTPIGILTKGARDAYPGNGLPADLQKYSHFDPQMDKSASEWLLKFYQGIANETAEETDRKFLGLRETIFQDIQSAPSKRQEVTLPQEHTIRRIVLARQYRQTLMIILQFADNQTHLTLEHAMNSPDGIDKEDHVYGWPRELIRENPQLTSVIATDLLAKIVQDTLRRHPEQEVKPRRVFPGEATLPYYIPSFPQESEEIRLPVLTGKGRRHFPKILTPIQQVLAGEPNPPAQRERLLRKFRVDYSRTQIEEFLPRNAPQNTIDQLMKAIRSFEYGRGNFKRFKEDRTEGESLWELRTGDYRLLLKHKEGQIFSLEKVGHRREIFSQRRRG
ncbi:MAG: hypothetical protein G01um10147_146 [Microgenomates group bacterium Gr01-1014_7]|nr:MAG: hypothetical protein G01um10147_146 [Microgenomates group bacterium Gr01-1014_7]